MQAMRKRPYISHALEVRYSDLPDRGSSIESQMGFVFELLKSIASFAPSLSPSQWLVATGEKDSSYLYRAFDDKGPTSAALAVLHEGNKKQTALQNFTLWNGEEGRTKGASVSCLFGRKDGRSSSLTLSLDSEPDKFSLGNASNGIALITEAARIYKPAYCGLSPEQYDPVFPDRPGVGWMLYLPQVLAAQNVPEARALVPFMDKDGKGVDKQVGTIIVSVTDEPFSDQKLEHVQIANAIEIRLVDQDLLPRFADL